MSKNLKVGLGVLALAVLLGGALLIWPNVERLFAPVNVDPSGEAPRR